ncbi:MAG: Gfo/Idh/MocA family protein, partial [Anaerolineae bacterium]
VQALEAGKHVLCEKPVALDAGEARDLLEASRAHPEQKVMEAFMYRFHPQWQRVWEIVLGGGVGQLRTIQSFFSYYNVDPRDIRNQPGAGGGALMDIGCYCVSLSRWMYQDEPQRVLGLMEADPEFGVDRLTAGVLAFEQGTATFTCGTQLGPYQQVNLVGTRGRVEIEFPFGTPADRACRLWHHTDDGAEEILVGPVNHYTLQGELFSQAVLAGTDVPTPLEDAVGNMAVIDAIVRSAQDEAWVAVS